MKADAVNDFLYVAVSRIQKMNGPVKTQIMHNSGKGLPGVLVDLTGEIGFIIIVFFCRLIQRYRSKITLNVQENLRHTLNIFPIGTRREIQGMILQDIKEQLLKLGTDQIGGILRVLSLGIQQVGDQKSDIFVLAGVIEQKWVNIVCIKDAHKKIGDHVGRGQNIEKGIRKDPFPYQEIYDDRILVINMKVMLQFWRDKAEIPLPQRDTVALYRLLKLAGQHILDLKKIMTVGDGRAESGMHAQNGIRLGMENGDL